MKKTLSIILILLITILSFSLGFVKSSAIEPNTYYKIYLKDEYIGLIKSDDELNDYINKMGQEIKNKYNITQVLAPSDINIKKVLTYDQETMTVEEIYSILNEKSKFTIMGYEYKIVDNEDIKTVYVLNQKIFTDSIEEAMKTIVGEEEYNLYKSNEQAEILTTGTKTEDIYIEGDISFKYLPINVDKKIYNDVNELSNYFLYGEEKKQSTYTVKEGDTIQSISLENKITEEEFLLSNPKFSNSNNLLYPGQLVSIVELNPQIKIVSEQYIVNDLVKSYTVLETYDSNKLKGDNEVIQEGEDGLERVTQNVKTINGVVVDARNVSKVELRPAVNEIVVKGDKIIPNVGSLYSWLWPTDSGYRITSRYGWRTDPVFGGRSFHYGLDISGLGYGANIYASNNGTVHNIDYSPTGFGNYVVINHNNGYYTLYAHMQKVAPKLKKGDTVSRGQIIGFIGSTGKSTGPHVHFEVHKGVYGNRINPYTVVK